MANPSVVTAPSHLPLAMEDLKRHLAIDEDDDTQDALLWSVNEAATSVAETFTYRRFVTTTLDYSIDKFPEGAHISLPGGQLQSITSLTYTDDDSTSAVWGASNYTAITSHEPGLLGLATTATTWPSVTLRPRDGVVIRYVVGYGTGDQVPGSIRGAISLLASHLYQNRESVVIGAGLSSAKVPDTHQAMLLPHRLWSF